MSGSSPRPLALQQARDELARRHLGDFVEATVQFKLHQWQRDHLCPTLERLCTERGLRLLIHGPPQYGKSVVLSKRLPAWALGRNPLARIILAGYNVTHATTQFAEPVRNVMLSSAYKRMFPATRLPEPCAAEAFSTTARARLHDGQDSVTAVGLLSGFTGKGIDEDDLLIIDDPYASPEEANSAVINDRVWRWWTETADVRLHEKANVVVMFHRYHDNDLAGRLIAQGGWEYIRFPAIADENEDGSDPTGRTPGQVLSPKHSLGHLRDIEERAPKVFLGQFQGKPRPDTGGFIRESYLQRHVGPLPKLIRWVRYWDLAVSKKQTADLTVGALVGIGSDNTVYLRNIVRERMEWPDAAELICSVTEADLEIAKREEWDYQVGVDARLSQLGFFQDLARKAMFQRLPLWPDRTKGDKKQRAAGWVARAKADHFRWIAGDWDFEAFKAECLAFDGMGLTHDDQVDAVSGAYQLIWELHGGKTDENKPLDNNSVEYFERLESLQNGG